MSVKIIETPDRYLVVDAETGLNVEESDSVGFSYEESAIEWAKRSGFEIV
jgi:hypothetical protein